MQSQFDHLTAMQGVNSFPVVWTPDGSVIIRGTAAPAYAERKNSARVFTGPFFPSAGRASHEAVEAWLEIANIMALQTASLDQSASSSKLSISSVPVASRTKFTRENVTVHMHMFRKKALDFVLQSHRAYEHAAALDGALALTEAFFACKGISSAVDSLCCFGCISLAVASFTSHSTLAPLTCYQMPSTPCSSHVMLKSKYSRNIRPAMALLCIGSIASAHCALYLQAKTSTVSYSFVAYSLLISCVKQVLASDSHLPFRRVPQRTR